MSSSPTAKYWTRSCRRLPLGNSVPMKRSRIPSCSCARMQHDSSTARPLKLTVECLWCSEPQFLRLNGSRRIHDFDLNGIHLSRIPPDRKKGMQTEDPAQI